MRLNAAAGLLDLCEQGSQGTRILLQAFAHANTLCLTMAWLGMAGQGSGPYWSASQMALKVSKLLCCAMLHATLLPATAD